MTVERVIDVGDAEVKDRRGQVSTYSQLIRQGRCRVVVTPVEVQEEVANEGDCRRYQVRVNFDRIIVDEKQAVETQRDKLVDGAIASEWERIGG